MGGKKYNKTVLDALNADKDFQTKVGSDKELDRIWNLPRRTRDNRIAEMVMALGGSAQIGTALVPAPSAGVLMILGQIDSPLLIGGASPTLLDVDIALYVFMLGKDAVMEVSTHKDIEDAAAGWCERWQADRIEAWSIMAELVSAGFTAFERIPQSTGDGRKCKFDLAWFAKTCSRITEVAGVDYETAGWEIPLALASNFMLALHEKNGGKTYDPSDNESLFRRLNELMDIRIAEKGYK